MKIFDAIQQVTPCPKTKSKGCQCDRLEGITEAEQTIQAIVELEHVVGDIEGFVKFKQKANGPTIIKGILKGLEPGKHGFHIHEFGDLSDGCKSAGGHYNPEGVDHGDLSQGHVGDLGNIVADKSGTARFQIKAERVELSDVVGRAIVIHADEDDLGKGGDEESTKTGNAGDRLACGVIRLREVVEEDYNRSVSNKHFDRNQLPQINRKDVQDSDFSYKEGKVSLINLKPVQSQRVHGYDKKAEDVFLKDIDKPFIIDKNGYIINGHHRYDAANMLGIKRVKAIKINADIEDVINKFTHKSSNVKVIDENYFKKLLQEKMLDEGVKENFAKLKQALSTETGETKQMMDVYKRALKNQASPVEINTANKQFKDILKILGLTTFVAGTSMIPGTGPALFPIEKYLNTKGVSILPNGFKDAFPQALPKSLHKVGDKVTLDGATYDVLKVDVNTGTVDVKDQSGKVWTKVKSTTFFKEDVIDMNPHAKKPYFDSQSIQAAHNEYVNGAEVDRDIKIVGKDNQVYIISQNYDGDSQHYDEGDWYLTDANGTPVDFDSYPDPGELLYYHSLTGFVAEATSSPGRVKRSGASCRGSATELRAKAKKYSGEKGKMYHWCANMKGGKKKS